ncbi:hypothetical protein EAS64_42605 [Trebonia kvetii]|uniref:Uncharacterized protein n=1 Tax=Trebonia kvetii TaxID=2480626 RepID=A0A6P2BLI4_9ACTN|nr:hypothetical protein [Trebonia kvetii]TVY98951.1 hypothetical protein EAS64_42605 [Trebonia kvetii]
MTAILDHLAIGTPTLPDGWELIGVLGGTWAYGGNSPGYWWGQLKLATGPKIELLTPTGAPARPSSTASWPAAARVCTTSTSSSPTSRTC